MQSFNSKALEIFCKIMNIIFPHNGNNGCVKASCSSGKVNKSNVITLVIPSVFYIAMI